MSNTPNDDAGTRADPRKNQETKVQTATGVIPNAASVNSSKGTAPSFGPSGTLGSYETPGRRTFNPLSKLSSYTYNFSLYMITPDEYDAFLLSGRKKINALSNAVSLARLPNQNNPSQTQINPEAPAGVGAFLIAQSGGINNTVDKRAPGFELDYYIDDVKFLTETSTRSTEVPAFVQNLTMTITEPYGFSFLSNLKKATEAMQQYSNKSAYKNATGMNPFRQFFILGIRFYGYDKNGAVLKGDATLENGAMLDPGNATEALFERFYDVALLDLKFNINGRTTVYNFSAVSVGAQTMIGTKRGRILTGSECVGATVKEMLEGEKGLLTSLNKEQQDQVNNLKSRSVANEYKVKFIDTEAEVLIGNSSMVTQSDLLKYSWASRTSAETTGQVTDYTSVTAVPDSRNKKLSFAADTSIIQAISSIIQKSNFMVNALSSVYNNVLQPSKDGKGVEYTANPTPSNIKWFVISTEVTVKDWDPRIADWAYVITYIINVYETPALGTPFNDIRAVGEVYYGPHKYLNYFFTGQNSEVLDLSIAYNLAYQNIILANTPEIEKQQNNNAAPGTYNGQVPVVIGARTGGDSTGFVNTAAEAQNQVITLLTDPTAYNPGKMTIMGDPDFLMQDQISSISELYQKFYNTDLLTISAHGGFVFVEVIMKEAQDYENSKGLLRLNENIEFQRYPKNVADVAKGIIYRVERVVSSFSAGKFTQVLDIAGNLPWSWPAENTDETSDGNRSSTTPGPAGTEQRQAAGNTGTMTDPLAPTVVQGGNSNVLPILYNFSDD